MRTLAEWGELIEIRWMESVGYCSTENFSVLSEDRGRFFHEAILRYKMAMDADNEGKKSARLRACAKAAGEFVRISVEQGNLDNIRNLYLRLDSIRNGKVSKVIEHAKDRVGMSLLNFIREENRLPKNRSELSLYCSKGSIRVGLPPLTARNLADALEYYSLNETIRDKTGPKPGK